MNIVVYCSSRYGNSPAYDETAKELGTLIGNNGHTLVFGGSKAGTMDTLCKAVLDAGGETIGVVPDVAFIKQRANPNLSQRIETKDIADRKNTMISLGDAFIALPGGFGTFDEIFTTIEQHFFDGSVTPMILINTNGYYNHLKDVLFNMLSEEMCDERHLELVYFAKDAKDAMDYIEENKL